MGRFDDVRCSPRLSRLVPLASAEIAKLRSEAPGLPDDYVDFLAEVGYGDIGDSSFSLYSGPVPASSIYDPRSANDLRHLRLFGDDYQGCCAGFDPSQDWAIVEIEPTDKSVDVMAKTFEEYVRGTLLG